MAQASKTSALEVTTIAPVSITSNSRDIAFLDTNNTTRVRIQDGVRVDPYLSSSFINSNFNFLNSNPAVVSQDSSEAPDLNDISVVETESGSYLDATGRSRAKEIGRAHV